MNLDPRPTDTAQAVPEAFVGRRILLWPLAAMLLVAATMRCWAATDEPWLDEIWSVLACRQNVASPADILTLHSDNNHHLVSLWLWLVDPLSTSALVYRLPSLVAGLGTVALAALVASRWGTAACYSAALLTGASHFLIFYGTMARGYALAGFFALLALVTLERALRSPTALRCAAFAATCVLGILSHLTFVEAYLGALAWSTVACFGDEPNAWRGIRRWAALHAVPIVFIGTLYAIDVRWMVSSGDSYSLADVVTRSFSATLGAAGLPSGLIALFAAAAAGMVLAALVLLARRQEDVWIFFATAILFAPALVLGFNRPAVLYERYFYINVLFALIALSSLAAYIFQRGPAGRWATILLLAAFVVANVRLTSNLVRFGRSHMFDTFAYIAAHTQGDVAAVSTVTGAADAARSRLCAQYFEPLLPGGARLAWIGAEDEAAPDWIIRNDAGIPPGGLQDPARHVEYELRQTYRCADFDGTFNSCVYRRSAGDENKTEP